MQTIITPNGTSMRALFVPNYTNLCMGLWEEQYIYCITLAITPFLQQCLLAKVYAVDGGLVLLKKVM